MEIKNLITQKDIDFVIKTIKLFENSSYDFVVSISNHSILFFSSDNLITTNVIKLLTEWFSEISVSDNYFTNVPKNIKVVLHLENITKK